MKAWLSTLRGGAVMSKRIVAIEPALGKDNRWRIEATLDSGARFVLDAEFLDHEQARDGALHILNELHNDAVWSGVR